MTDIQLKHGPFAHAVTFWPGRDHFESAQEVKP